MTREARQATCWLGAVAVVSFGLLLPPAGGEEPKSQLDAKSQRFLLTGQEPPEPFVPLKPRTVEDTRRLEALKHFSIGCWLENEYRWNDAIESYKKALEHDPKSLAICKRLIHLTSVTRRSPESAKYLRQAIDLAPDDFELLIRLGDELAGQENFDAAAEVFKRAIASPKLDRRDPRVVVVKYELGGLFDRLKDFETAANCYRDVMEAMERPDEYRLNSLTARPSFLERKAEAYENFGNVFRQAKQYDDALRAFRRASANSPTRSRFAKNIAQVYMDQEKYDQALENLEKYLEEQRPHGSQEYELLATVLDKQGRSDEILPRVEAAAEKDRLNMGLQYFLGSLYENAGQIERAMAIYTNVLQNRGDDRVYRALARIYQKQDRLRDLILLLGDGLDKQLEGRAPAADALETMNEQLRVFASEPDAAAKLIETARRISQEEPNVLKTGSRYFVAKVAQVTKQTDAAVEFYRLLLAGQPRFPSLLCDAALALQQCGQTADALKAVGRAVELSPDHHLPQFIQARIYALDGQYAEAVRRCEQILRDFADNGEVVRDVRYLLSNLYLQLGDMAKSEKALEEILQENPDDSTANNDLGYLWADQGKNLDRALEMIRKALEQEPDNAAYLDSMGWVLYRLGRAAEARKYLEDAVAKAEGGEDGTIVDHLGDVYQRLKDPAKAREMWQRAASVLENAKGPRRDEKRLKEIQVKLKSLDEQRKGSGELKRERNEK